MSGLAWLVMACAGMEMDVADFVGAPFHRDHAPCKSFPGISIPDNSFSTPLPQGVSWRCIRTLNNFQHLRAGGFRTFTLCNKQMPKLCTSVLYMWPGDIYCRPFVQCPQCGYFPNLLSTCVIVAVIGFNALEYRWTPAKRPNYCPQ